MNGTASVQNLPGHVVKETARAGAPDTTDRVPIILPMQR